MQANLNTRGQVFLAFIIVITSLSVVLRSPTLVLISTFGLSYLIAYPLIIRNDDHPNLDLKVDFRHGILFRGEVDYLRIEVKNLSGSLIPMAKVSVELSPTLYFVDRPDTYFFSVEAESSYSLVIPILPTSRGSHAIGPISLSIGDPFLLFEQEIKIIENMNIRVYPKRLGYRVSKSETRRVFTKMIGMFATRWKGFGNDFHGLRDYIRGDPSKIVDWAATARKNKLISREFEEEKRLEVIIGLAAGTTTRGAKFDFMIGVALDIFEGVVTENHPCSVVIFEDEVIKEFKPTTSNRQKMHIWSQIYDLIPKDTFVDYKKFSKWIQKKGKTGDLVIIIGDLENELDMIEETIRDIRLRNNHCIFIDIWGYSFSYQKEVTDAAIDHSNDNFGLILGNVIGRGIEQDHIFRGVDMKLRFLRYGAAFGFIKGSDENIVKALDRALFSFFGKKWQVRDV